MQLNSNNLNLNVVLLRHDKEHRVDILDKNINEYFNVF